MLSKKSVQTSLLFSLIIASSLLFRATNLHLIEFKADEAINLFLAARPVFGYPFPPGGTVSSIGLLNPPILNYLLFPVVLVSLDPKLVTFYIAFLNSLAIGFFFLIICYYFNQTTALIASFLFAFSPWAILFSRKIWPQDLLIPFLGILLLAVFKILVEQKPKWWCVYVASSLILIQLHQANVIFLSLLTFFFLFKKPKLSFKFIILGSLIGLLPLIPYLLYLFNSLNNPAVFLVAKGRFAAEYLPIIFLRPLQIASQGNFRFVLGDDTLTFRQQFPLIFQLRKLFYLEYFLIPLGMIIFWKKYPLFRFLLYSSLMLSLIYFLIHFQPFIHYFIILLPLLFLFLAVFFDFLIKKGGIYRTTSVVLAATLILVSLGHNIAFFNLLASRGGLKGDYGPAFVSVEKEAKANLKEYQTDPSYSEMLLASYLNKEFLYGHLPVARMLWSPAETEKKLSVLEERLKQVPKDSRVQNELLAFYTFSKPTMKVLIRLEQKADEITGYETIYQKTVQLFRVQNP